MKNALQTVVEYLIVYLLSWAAVFNYDIAWYLLDEYWFMDIIINDEGHCVKRKDKITQT